MASRRETGTWHGLGNNKGILSIATSFLKSQPPETSAHTEAGWLEGIVTGPADLHPGQACCPSLYSVFPAALQDVPRRHGAKLSSSSREAQLVGAAYQGIPGPLVS